MRIDGDSWVRDWLILLSVFLVALSVVAILGMLNINKVDKHVYQIEQRVLELNLKTTDLNDADRQLTQNIDVVEKQLTEKIRSNTIDINQNIADVQNTVDDLAMAEVSLQDLKDHLSTQIENLLGSISAIEATLTGQQQYFEQEDTLLKSLIEVNLTENKNQLTSLEDALRSVDLSVQQDIEKNNLSLQAVGISVKEVEEETSLIRELTARSLMDADSVYRESKDSVVEILNGTNVAGSGFLVGSNRRHIMTAWHVVDEISYGFLKVRTTTGDVISAYVSATDIAEDIAVLRLHTPLYFLDPLELESSAKVDIGQPILVIGSPGGMLPGTVTSGIVGGVGLDKTDFIGAFVNTPTYEPSGLIQFDAKINGGNSGGPVINVDGKVIGMVSFVLLEDRLAFGPSADILERVLG